MAFLMPPGWPDSGDLLGAFPRPPPASLPCCSYRKPLVCHPGLHPQNPSLPWLS